MDANQILLTICLIAFTVCTILDLYIYIVSDNDNKGLPWAVAIDIVWAIFISSMIWGI